MNWKIITISSLINAALTVGLSVIYLPLLFLGPVVGGFLSSYLSHGFEDYARMDIKDGAVLGAISGIIGGLMVGLLFILGFGDIMDLTSAQLGSITGGMVISGYIIFQISVGLSLVLGLIGGILGVILKKQD